MGALILRGDRIVLIERGRQPLKGYWSLPGGAVEAGEQVEEALRREVLEETGLQVEPRHLVEVFERITRDKSGRAEYHYVLLDYLCRLRGGRLRAADDAAGARWVRRGDLTDLRLTEGTLAVIERAFEMR